MNTLIRPKEVCERLGVSRRKLKQYETQGLIYPIKLSSRTFRYDPEDVAALALQMSFSTDEGCKKAWEQVEVDGSTMTIKSCPQCNQAPELQNGSC